MLRSTVARSRLLLSALRRRGRPRLLALTGALTLMALTLTRCSDSTADDTRLLVGTKVTVGQGSARVEISVNGSGQPSNLAVVLDELAMSGLPVAMTEFILPMPTGATGLPFDHITLGWAPTGHPPAGIYDVPHFDIHYYLISMQQRDSITPASSQFAARTAKQPAASSIPLNYLGDPNAVPRMGVHWTDKTSPERNGQPFTKTFIYGFYDGAMVFLEPMIAKSFLESRQTVTADVASPAAFSRAGAYPTSYSVRYDAARKEYRVEVLGFVTRS
jgi:hypothetical protein